MICVNNRKAFLTQTLRAWCRPWRSWTTWQLWTMRGTCLRWASSCQSSPWNPKCPRLCWPPVSTTASARWSSSLQCWQVKVASLTFGQISAGAVNPQMNFMCLPFLWVFSTVLFHGSNSGPETTSHPVPHEVPASRGRPLRPHQYLQGFQTVPPGPTLVKEASPTKQPNAYFYSWLCPPLTLPPVPFWSLSDCNVEKWCQDLHLNHAALLMADAIHTQLTDTLKRIEMPVSAPAFGSSSNTLNIKKALLAGFFMQVRRHNSGQQKNITQLFFQTPRFFMVTFRSQLVHSNAARHNTE